MKNSPYLFESEVLKLTPPSHSQAVPVFDLFIFCLFLVFFFFLFWQK